MRYKIFEKGEEINVIVADAEFVTNYCKKNGYTFEEEVLPDTKAETEATTDDVLNALLGVTV